MYKWLCNEQNFTNADKLLKLLEPIENPAVLLQAEDKLVIYKTGHILQWLVFMSDKFYIRHYTVPH